MLQGFQVGEPPVGLAKIGADVETPAACAVRQHIAKHADEFVKRRNLGADPVNSGIEFRPVGQAPVASIGGIRRLMARPPAVLQGFVDRRADLQHQRSVCGERGIGAFQDGQGSLALQAMREFGAGKRSEQRQVQYAGSNAFLVSQVICHCPKRFRDGALRQDHDVRIIDPMFCELFVMAAGELTEFAHRADRYFVEVLDKKWPLRGHGAEKALLILHATQARRVIGIDEPRNAPSLFTE